MNKQSAQFSFSIIFLFAFFGLSAQMRVGQDTLYGHEWIRPGSEAVRLAVVDDGMYRVTGAELLGAGMQDGVSGADLRLLRLGQEVPLMVSTDGVLGGNDEIVFYGEKGRSQLDRYLFKNAEAEMLNPGYGLFTDTMVYYLVWESVSPEAPLRYQEWDENGGLSMAVDVAEAEVGKNFHDLAVYKRYDATNLVALSSFDVCEGFASSYLTSHEVVLTLPQMADSADFLATLHLRMASWFEGNHKVRVSVNGVVVHNGAYGAYELIELEIPVTNLVDGGNAVVTIEGENGNLDRYAVSEVSIRYRRVLDVGGEASLTFFIPADSFSRALSFDGLTGGEAWIFSPGQGRMTMGLPSNGEFTVEVPPIAVRDTVVVVNGEAGFLTVPEMGVVSFSENLFAQDAEYLILTHSALRAGVVDQVQRYADYRTSEAGGGYRVAVVDMESVYRYFGYGVSGHPIGIRNFFAYAQGDWPALHTVLLLGHGMTYPEVRDPGSGNRSTHFVPTWGVPGSDNLLMARPGHDAPMYAVGRIAARTPEEVGQYLDKIMAYESGFGSGQTVGAQAWRKRVLHLVGGNPAEQQSFRFLLDLMGQDFLGTAFGAQLQTVLKTSTEPVQSSPSEEVIQAVNEGVVIKTFLGHGAVSATGFGLDDPSFFSHNGRYPLILSLGCLSGNVFDPQNSVSERFVLAEESGSIGYIASSGFGYAGTLASFGRQIYTLLGGDMYGHGLGEIIRTIKEGADQSASFPVRSLVQQLHLHADPVLRLSNLPLPDYVIDYTSTRHSPQSISSTLDSLTVSFDLMNLGRHAGDTLLLRFERVAESGGRMEWYDTVVAESSVQRVEAVMAVGGPAFRGENRLFVAIDPDDELAEGPLPWAEQNNMLERDDGLEGYVFFVENAGAHPVYPPPFAMVGSGPELVACLNDPLAEDQKYMLEIDTTARYDSPLRRSVVEGAEAGVLRWVPEMDWVDERVYYWRVGPEGRTDEWESASFVYLEGAEPGWNQSHLFQWQENVFENAEFSEASRRLEFADTRKTVIAEAMVTTAANQDRSRYFINNDRMLRTVPAWGRNLVIALIDPFSGVPMVRPGTQTPGYIFPVFDAEDRGVVIDFLRDSIPDGYYVLFMTWHEEGSGYDPELWAADSLVFGANLFGLLEMQGAEQVRELESVGSRPYAFAWVQGEGALGEVLGQEGEERVSVMFDMEISWREGAMVAPLIGPSVGWHQLSWALGDTSAADRWRVTLSGMRQPGAVPAAVWTGLASSGTIELPDTVGNAWPWLSLRLDVADSTDRTPPTPLRWRLFGEGTGDATFRPEAGVKWYSDTLGRGAPFWLEIRVENLLEVPMDSLLVKVRWTGPDNRGRVDTFRIGPLPGGGWNTLSYSIRTDEFALGRSVVAIELNPDGDQPEGNVRNNRLVLPVEIMADRSTPFLGVTFDGTVIKDGAIVSARPVVDVWLRDENPWLLVDDTAALSVWWRFEGEPWNLLESSDPSVRFEPETLAGDGARLVWTPFLEREGWYELRATGRDAAGNVVGGAEYLISFRVIRAQALTNFVAFPNPMRRTCRFAYTLTGESAPSSFSMDIYSATGRLVRSLDESTFGQLRVGSHISDFVWDGTDEAGREVPAGGYFFRVRGEGGEVIVGEVVKN
ncbi:MAG: C25 family cysteine peptidase [Saprospiraceae bacterium]